MIRPRPATRVFLNVDELESRLVPATRFVVPAGQQDNVSKFTTLNAALTAPGLADGDTVKIDRLALPGELTSNPTTVDNLTIEGASSFGTTSGITISGNFVVPTGQTGLTFKNIGISTPKLGVTIDCFESINLLGVSLSSFSTASVVLNLRGSSNQIAGCSFAVIGVANSDFIRFTSATDSANLVDGNRFQILNLSGGSLLTIAPTTSISTADRIVNNFVNGLGGSGYTMIDVSTSSGTTSGLTIRGNVLIDYGTPQPMTAVSIGAGTTGFTIEGNRITADSPSAIGIEIVGGASSTIAGVINGNNITASQGTGMLVAPGDTPGTVDLTIQGNTFDKSVIGVLIDSNGLTGPVTGIDLGRGLRNSLGGNIFRSFTTSATSTSGAIVVTGTTAGVVSAQGNSFSGAVTPANVIFGGPTTVVDVSNPLSANAAYVAALYSQTLYRAGDFSNGMDAGLWVGLLDGGGSREMVATGVLRSAEASAQILDKIFLHLLVRSPDPTGAATFTEMLQSGSMEQVIATILVSEEYVSHWTGGQKAFTPPWIESMYRGVLGFTDPDGINFWANVLQSQGPVAVANGIAFSVQFRQHSIVQLYGIPNYLTYNLSTFVPPNLLHRTDAPTEAEINGWAASGLDLTSIAVAFASSDEYYLRN